MVLEATNVLLELLFTQLPIMVFVKKIEQLPESPLLVGCSSCWCCTARAHQQQQLKG